MIYPELFEAARAAYGAGLCVLPAGPGKHPPIKWAQYQSERMGPDELERHLAGVEGIGYVCGAVSGNLLMIELERRAVDHGLLERFMEHPLVERIAAGYYEKSASGGVHLLVRCTGPVGGSDRLARDADNKVLIESRGESGFTVAAPSGGRTHPKGGSWKLLRGGVETIVILTPEELLELLEFCRSFDRSPLDTSTDKTTAKTNRAPLSTGDDDRPGAVFNRTGTWDDVGLWDAGWQKHPTKGVGLELTRPGKDPREGHSATLNYEGNDRLIVFSTETPFETYPETYSKFAAYAVLNHGGDFSAASSALRALGYGEKPERPVRNLPGAGSEKPVESEASPNAAVEGSDLADCIVPWNTMRREHEPDLIEGWLQAGVVSLLAGDGDTGKTMCEVAMDCCVATHTQWLGTSVSKDAGPVIYWGAEDPSAIPDRIAAWEEHNGIRVPPDRLHVVDVPPGLHLTLKDLSWLAAIERKAIAIGASKITVDTVSVAGGLVSENDNAEVGAMIAGCVRLANATSAHISILVHTPKGGSGPRGASAFRDNVRQVLEIVVDKEGSTLKMTKNNNGPKPRPHRFEIVGVSGIRKIRGQEPQSVGVMVLDASAAAGRAEDDEIVFEVLRSLGGEVGPVAISKLHSAIAVDLGWTRQKVYRWRDRMKPSHRIEVVGRDGLRIPAPSLVSDLLA
jgi:hypothetical protein